MDTLSSHKNESVNLAALSAAEMAHVLSAAGGKPIDEAKIESDIEAGAPVDADRKLNLLAYTAWLAHEAQELGH